MGGGQQTGRFGPQGHLGRVWGGGGGYQQTGREEESTSFVLVLCTQVVSNKIFKIPALSTVLTATESTHSSELSLAPFTSTFCPGQPRTLTVKSGPSPGTHVSSAQMTSSVLRWGLSMKRKVQGCKLCAYEKGLVAL